MDDPLERYARAAGGFARVLGQLRPDQLHAATPCAEWDVRQLVNHMARGNLNYALLAEGGSAADFLALRERDAVGDALAEAYGETVRKCAESFRGAGVLDRVLDYPLGKVSGRQALAVRTADTVIHTWDLAQALEVGAHLDPELVGWLLAEHESIYAGLDITAFFGTAQDRLLRLFGRTP